MPAALAIALTLVAGFYFVHSTEVAPRITPVADEASVK